LFITEKNAILWYRIVWNRIKRRNNMAKDKGKDKGKDKKKKKDKKKDA
jgi:hypothetical protein